jgi:ribosomal protein S17E
MTSIGFISEVCEDERKMFDSLLELDFMTLSNQNRYGLNEAAAINEATEEKVKFNIVEKARQIIDKFSEVITNAWERFKDKVNELMKNTDKKLVDKYNGNITANWDKYKKDFKGLKDFNVIDFNKLGQLKSAIHDTYEKDYSRDLKAGRLTSEDNYGIPEIFSNTKVFVPTKDYLINSKKDLLNSDSIVAEVKNNIKGAVDSLKKDLKTIEGLQKQAKKDKNEAQISSLKISYEAMTKKIKVATGALNYVISLNNLRLRSDRRAIFTCGAFVTKMVNAVKHESASEIDKLDDEIEVEEAYAFANIIGLASDTFCETVFASDDEY